MCYKILLLIRKDRLPLEGCHLTGTGSEWPSITVVMVGRSGTDTGR